MLRELLDRMTKTLTADEQPAELERIRQISPHSIAVLESVNPIQNYTCLMYVFDFHTDDDYTDIARNVPEVYAGAEFANWLIDGHRLVEVEELDVEAGDLVFYFDDGEFKHVGFWKGEGRVVSKWGQSHLLNHGLLEVPSAYGTEIRYFRPIDNDTAYELFVEFAEERGVRFTEVED